MNPLADLSSRVAPDFPRASGDEPQDGNWEVYRLPFSPREWG